MKLTLQEYFDGLSPEHRRISLLVRQAIFEAVPEVEETLKWKVPYYMYKGPIGYMSIKTDTVMFGFYWGKHMSDSFEAFEKNELKQVRQFAFRSEEDLRLDFFRAYVFEAIDINTQIDRPKYSSPGRKE